MPSTISSSRARRARCSASSRVAPVTISLASIESNAPATSPPVSTPESQRTPGPCGISSRVHRAGGGHEVAAGVLGVDPELDAVPARLGVLGDLQLQAVGDAELLADEVDAAGLLGDRVLDLQAGVDLEEGDRAVGADEVLDRAGAVVAGLRADGLRGLVDAGPLLVGEERRGRLLDQLLVAPLQRAVAGADDDRRCRGCRPAPGPRRAGACPGTARRSTRRGRTRRRPRGRRSRTARGSPRWCGRPSARGRRRRRRP